MILLMVVVNFSLCRHNFDRNFLQKIRNFLQKYLTKISWHFQHWCFASQNCGVQSLTFATTDRIILKSTYVGSLHATWKFLFLLSGREVYNDWLIDHEKKWRMYILPECIAVYNCLKKRMEGF